MPISYYGRDITNLVNKKFKDIVNSLKAGSRIIFCGTTDGIEVRGGVIYKIDLSSRRMQDIKEISLSEAIELLTKEAVIRTEEDIGSEIKKSKEIELFNELDNVIIE
jgi:hypothetical protein